MKKYITIEKYLSLKENKNKNKILWYVIFILCLIVFIFSSYTLIKWCIDNFKIKTLNDKIKENYDVSKNTNGELVNPPLNKNSNYYYYVEFPFYEVNFTNLLKQNNDTVAFIHLNNTLINYPVVKTNDNYYYLNHSFDNKKNSAGWIFMDYRNDIDNLSDNTIIYGHSRIDKTLFGSLRNVLTTNWQENKDNYVIYLTTIKEKMLFQIFSIYTIKSETYYITPDFVSDIDKQKWLDTMKKRNISPITTDVSINDYILTLSSCFDTKGGRIVVHAKLIKKLINN